MGCEVCDPDLLLRDDETPNRCQEEQHGHSACFDCGELVDPGELWVGKESGLGLCDRCMDKWVKAGRAKLGGEF